MLFFNLLECTHDLGLRFKEVLADAKYSSEKALETVRTYGGEPVIPIRSDSLIKAALPVGKGVIIRGARRLMEMFKKLMSVERLFSQIKERLLLGNKNIDKLIMIISFKVDLWKKRSN